MRKNVKNSTAIQPNTTYEHVAAPEWCTNRFFPVINTLLGSIFLAARPEVCIALSALAIWVI